MQNSSEIIISVIVCTYNRDEYIRNTLSHLVDQKNVTKDQYEVLIINNNSEDATEEICLRYIYENRLQNFKYFNEEQQGHTYARNRGIKLAKGKILAFIDDDAFVDHQYIYQLMDFFNDNPQVIAIGGKIIPIYENVEPKWMSTYLLPLVAALDMGDEIKPFKGKKFPIGANMAFRRIAFENYGLFNINLGRRGADLEGGDEKEMIYRIKKGKESIVYVPKVQVKHIIPQKRTKIEYIKKMAVGVGTSEKKRLEGENSFVYLYRYLEEIVKILGTIIISSIYLFSGKIQAASMLVKFRIWVISGFLNLK